MYNRRNKRQMCIRTVSVHINRNLNRKAVLSQGNRAMPQLLLSV